MNLELFAVGLRPHELERFFVWAFGADYKSYMSDLPKAWKKRHGSEIHEPLILREYTRMVSMFRGVVKTPCFGMPYTTPEGLDARVTI